VALPTSQKAQICHRLTLEPTQRLWIASILEPRACKPRTSWWLLGLGVLSARRSGCLSVRRSGAFAFRRPREKLATPIN
jgi:hypothetical protein